MTMPKASVNKDRLSALGKNYVRLARKVFGVEAVAIPKSVENFANSYFRLAVFASDAGHPLTSFNGC